MYRLVYSINQDVRKKYFDDFSELYYFCHLGLICNRSFIVIRYSCF